MPRLGLSVPEQDGQPDDKIITAAGEVLFGAEFKASLAGLLNVKHDTVRHWCNGREAVPEGVWVELDSILSRRQDALEAAIRAVAERVLINETHKRR